MYVKTIFYTLALFGSLAAPALAAEPSQTVVDFTGELVDQNAAPVSGVLPLEFKIYTDEKSKKPIATESHFIAVVDGSYAIALGESSQIKTTKGELYVAVLLDGKELMRQKVAVQKQLIATTPNKVQTKKASDVADDDQFKLECPAGYVVTGVEGSLSNIGDLRLICAKAI